MTIVSFEGVGERFYDRKKEEPLPTNLKIKSIYANGMTKIGRYKASFLDDKEGRSEVIMKYPYHVLSAHHPDICDSGYPVFMNKECKSYLWHHAGKNDCFYSELGWDTSVALPFKMDNMMGTRRGVVSSIFHFLL